MQLIFVSNGVFFSTKKCALYLKKCNSKRVVCFIRNNLHFPMGEGIAFYALHKSKVLIIPCKANGFCLFIGLPDKILKKSPGILDNDRI